MAEKRGHYNHKTFKVRDRVRVQDHSSRRWSFLREITNKITADDGSSLSYEIRMDSGQELIRNRMAAMSGTLKEKQLCWSRAAD